MAQRAMRNPRWRLALTRCMSCSYNLEGLAPIGSCPECGATYGGNMLILTGVTRQAERGTPLWRQLLWALIILSGIAFSQLFVLVFFVPVWITLPAIALWLVLLIYMLRTGKTERAGIHDFVFLPCGHALCNDIEQDEADFSFMPWEPGDFVEIKRNGPVWRTLTIRSRSRKKKFTFGARLRDEEEDQIREGLNQLIRGEVLEFQSDAEATEEPKDHHSLGPSGPVQ